jgi:prepilin-type N-terminal cleavage/methylation domain-containing protein
MLKKYKKYKTSRGFTLIEMTVSIFIIALISGLFLINYRSAERSSSLSAAAQEMVSNIRSAQNNSLGSKDFKQAIPAGGWGINFDSASTTYTIFADVNGDRKYSAGENYQFIKLPPSVVINSINIISAIATTTVANADIVFLPPDPQTFINKYFDADNNTGLRITLRETASNATKVIEVNSFGLIDLGQ